MAAAADDEVEDLTSCSICFYPYDEDAHKPKYLSCHHTFCLECIRTLPRAKGGVLSCPKCRKKTTCTVGQVEKLASNAYAIHMITAAVNNNNNHVAPQTDGLINHRGRWCTKCKLEALPSCVALSHITFSMGSKSAEFCQQLCQSKEIDKAQLSSIIEKRKQARTYLNEVTNAHKLVGEAIRRLEEDNNVHFAQMNSLFESAIITEDETALSLSLKQEETRELIKEELTDVQVLEKTYLQHVNGKTKITFACHREGVKVPSNMPLYEQETDPNNQDQVNQRKMLKAATHVLLSLLKIGDQPPAPPPINAVVNQVAQMVPVMMPTTRLQESFFAMTFQQSCLTGRATRFTNYGTVFIKSFNTFYGPPSGSFGLLSSSSPPIPVIGATVGKSFANSYVCIPGILNLLQALFPNPATFLSMAVVNDAIDPLDVKLVEFQTLTGFEFVFFLNGFQEKFMPYNNQQTRSVRFGRIVDGENVLQVLSRLTCAQRTGFSVYIEYRCT